jgi:hypothetical protein
MARVFLNNVDRERLLIHSVIARSVSDEAIRTPPPQTDCFASLAMTEGGARNDKLNDLIAPDACSLSIVL